MKKMCIIICLMKKGKKRKIQITETVLRDAHQSLLATRMKTEDMLPILEKMDEVGYFSLEAWGGATFDVCLRFLNENPWERLRQIRQRVKKTKLQMLLRGQNLVGYRHYPDDIVEKFIYLAKENGIDIFRIFDAVNDIRNMEYPIKVAKKIGAIVEGTISYTVSPVHTIEEFVRLANNFKDLGCDIICIKDMAGLISPKSAYDLVKALKENVKLPVHLHSHCTSGVAPISYFAAAQAGVDIVDCAISPLSFGTSQPATETIVGAFAGTEFDTGLDLDLLIEIANYFQKVREKYLNVLDPIAERIDPTLLLHQIPGGMISNLVSQLKEQNALDKYQDVLKEVARVRKDMGYPPLVTPTSQIVGTQAVLNVVLGERYKVIPKEVKDYVRGMYGKPPGEISLQLKELVLSCGEEPIDCRPADILAPEYEKAKEEIKDISEKEEDIISYALFPGVFKEFCKKQNEKAMHESKQLKQDISVGSIEVKEDIKEKYLIEYDNAKYTTEILSISEDKIILLVDDEKYFISLKEDGGKIKANVDGDLIEVEIDEIKDGEITTRINNKVSKVKYTSDISGLPSEGKPEIPKAEKEIKEKPKEGNVVAPMPGKVSKVLVKVGEKVEKGKVVLILEAMKMENEITATTDGIVKDIYVSEGVSVNAGDVLINIV